MRTRTILVTGLLALAAACSDDTPEAAGPATSAPTATVASTTLVTTTMPAPTTTRAADVAKVATAFRMTAADVGTGVVAATNPLPITSAESQKLFERIRSDAACAPVKDGFPPAGYLDDLKFDAYFAQPNGATFSVQLFASTATNTAGVLEAYSTQRPLLATCEEKHIRALLPDYTRTAIAAPTPTGFAAPVAYSTGTVTSALARVDSVTQQAVVATGPFRLFVVQQGPAAAVDEATFLRVARLAAQRLVDAMAS